MCLCSVHAGNPLITTPAGQLGVRRSAVGAGGGIEKLTGAWTDRCGGQEGVTAQRCLLSGARGAANRRTSHPVEPRCPHPPGSGKVKRNRANGPHSLEAPWIPAASGARRLRGARDQSQEALRSVFIVHFGKCLRKFHFPSSKQPEQTPRKPSSPPASQAAAEGRCIDLEREGGGRH